MEQITFGNYVIWAILLIMVNQHDIWSIRLLATEMAALLYLIKANLRVLSRLIVCTHGRKANCYFLDSRETEAIAHRQP